MRSASIRSSVSPQAGSSREIVAHRRVVAGQRTQLVDPVRIGQEAQVEHQIGGPRDAAGKAEGGDGQHRLVGIAAIAPAISRAARPGSGRSCRSRCRRRCAAGGQVRARGQCRPRPAGRARADGAAGSRRSGGSARCPSNRGRGFPDRRRRSSGCRSGRRAGRSRGCGRPCRPRPAPSGPAPPPWTKASSRSAGRLSTPSQPMSSSASSTVDLPAPDMPVTSSRRGGRARRAASEFETHAVERHGDLGRRRCGHRVDR